MKEPTMANELENSIRSAAEKVAKYIADAATMTVETSYVEIGPSATTSFDQARPAARTVVKLDGDSSSVLPLRSTADDSLEIDSSLFAIHERNVQTAIEYRAKILSSVIGILLPARRS
jgi:hypothetical protein